ncbi:SDR family NAD(P)-dependent oxidoreductase [Shimia litoralis]|uniref:SDR family NAD(P)-dependent oxidoreductase n=1 Tax=Shimia litoralis TaxID=420403 RepID=A0A4U7N284_9RHOB|nr:SDR family NAD(P)-dependent oxidoreductase [Shimia litoralis]TKZ19276.1 SDR family NAD(P)-dependent oxidoreductase [Shimia litoralis]
MKTAVISGGNGGLGQALARRLQGQGWRTVLLDLNIDGLSTTETQIPLACDLTDARQLADATAQIIAMCPTIDLVIYNAGITQIGAFSDTSVDTIRKVFEINVFAAINMAKAFLTPLRDSQGTHLAISSVAGFSPLYHRTAYAASKHALEGFFGSLRSEEAAYGVKSLIAAPSFVATNIGNDQRQSDGVARPGSATDGLDYMTPDQAADIILRGVSKHAAFTPVGRIARLSYVINRVSPRLFQHLMEKNIKGT